jgi:hypothetical protein
MLKSSVLLGTGLDLQLLKVCACLATSRSTSKRAVRLVFNKVGVLLLLSHSNCTAEGRIDVGIGTCTTWVVTFHLHTLVEVS